MTVKLARTSVAAVLASTLLLAGCNSGDQGKEADKSPTSQSTSSPSTGTPSTGDTRRPTAAAASPAG
ncbi:hypothetical protein GCM10022237_38820 [Nocardioides ginsengisoli]|uniref:Uncharacterized protein n=1 Tax=Nocardioides ginsengisoli TaxID=363868 RepID=A0ABW3VY15_9ACTN